MPSLRYLVHLKAPGLDVIGAGEPALPGVSVGHNEVIAFGLTIFAIDQEDLYVYDLNPANPRQYRYGGVWEDMQVVHETIPVKGAAPREAELLFTRHGPVVKTDGKHAFAVRTVWAQPGTSAYFGSISGCRSRSRASSPPPPATSAGSAPAGPRSGRTGTDCCRSQATAAMSGRASSPPTNCPVYTTPRRAGSLRPMK